MVHSGRIFAGCGAALVSILLGCASSPSPLAPSFRGSVGAPHNGVLTESAELPASGPGFRRFRQRASTYFGLPRLVRGVERAAGRVAEAHPGGPPLVVGDFSVAHGGKISRHNSHRSGRDVDLLFFVTSPQGIPFENPGFFTLEADGFVKFPDQRYGLLDVPREWSLIEALLTDPEMDVQFLFISKELEALLIDYALAKSDDYALIWHAQSVMLQPGDSLPHGDHIHMRIACKADETVDGCSGGGPHWPWFAPLPTPVDVDTAMLLAIRDTDPFELGPLPADSPTFLDVEPVQPTELEKPTSAPSEDITEPAEVDGVD